jgi:hypothetical protein
MDEPARVRETNRKRWRRLLIGVVCLSCPLSGAVYDAVHSKTTVVDAVPARTERVWFAPPEAPVGQPGG